ncbi:ATP-dependent RecD-like DNA helicase [Mammaliicoccus sciuri]|uniref:ATP-dependent RecD-like DNA helicase n=1 Tax=Mammaliicoccus sciuri TaxID=1296 RepID=UPI0021CF5E5B|nr:ATP-dependent RecD-like DNA helicase [Mammaliicoccus sciuri]UXU70113.1 ATP-dependent RecD-like DNA helicase [Mammaliicoccus sciuri]
MEERIYQEELIVTKEVYYREGNMFKVYGFKFANEINPIIKVHPTYQSFTIAGTNAPPLEEGRKYIVKFKDSYSEQRGEGYEFISVVTDGIKGKEGQEDFIKAILTEKQAHGILSKFKHEDNIVDKILSDEVDLTEVKGIGEQSVITIKEKLYQLEVYEEAIRELSPLGVGIKNIQTLTEHYGSAARLVKTVKENIYSLTKVHGFGFKRVDVYALQEGMDKNDKRRILAGAHYVIEQLVGFGDTKIDINRFDDEMCKILDIEEVNDELFSQILSDKEIYYKEGYISLKKYYEEEEKILFHLRRIREKFDYDLQEQNIKEIVEMNESKLGFKFNTKQLEAIDKGSKNGVFILDGKAGSGKSASLLTLIEVIDKSHVACALSGKASNVLAQNGLNAATIHRTLKYDPADGGFLYDYTNPLPVDVVVLDEASMVDNGLLLNLLSAVPDGAQLFIVGDSGQLPAIGRGAAFDYLLSSTEFAHTTLTEVHRQALDSGTLEIANKIRDGEQFNANNDYGRYTYGNNKDLMYFSYQDKENILGDLLAMASRFIENPKVDNNDLQVITGMKERGDLSVYNLNILLQPLFNKDNMNSPDILSNKKYTFRKNDRVIQQGNNYRARVVDKVTFNNLSIGLINTEEIETEETQVFNGTFGYIVDCSPNLGMLVQFDDTEGLVFFEKTSKTDETGVLDLGYAISCHRSQGSGFKTLFFALSFNEYMLLSRQFLYTGLTRTINNCLLFAENKALHYAIKTDKGKTRKCFLGELLQK